ncbi:8-oxo-dGTP diphosphatase [uncultured Gammaproteobacteria bacterium]
MPLRREYPNRPWVGVGVVVWQGDEILLVRRANPPRVGQWGLPGGAQALGETLFEAAAREVLEETGVVVAPYAVITAVDGITRDRRGVVQFHYTLIEIAAECRSGEVRAADDATEARWVRFEDVSNFVEWDETVRVVMLSAEQRRRRA